MKIFGFFSNNTADVQETKVYREYARIAGQLTTVFYTEETPYYVDEYGFEYCFAYTSEEDALKKEDSVLLFKTDFVDNETFEAIEGLIEAGVIAY